MTGPSPNLRGPRAVIVKAVQFPKEDTRQPTPPRKRATDNRHLQTLKRKTGYQISEALPPAQPAIPAPSKPPIFSFFFFSLAIKTEAPYHIRPVFPHLNKFRNPWTTTSRCRTPTLASLSESFCERDGAFPGPVWGCCGDDDDCDGKHRSLLSDPRSRAAASVSSPPSPSSSEEAAAAAADVSPSTTDCCRLNRQGVLVPGDSHSMPGDDGLLEDGGCSLPSALASSREALPWKRRRTTVPK